MRHISCPTWEHLLLASVLLGSPLEGHAAALRVAAISPVDGARYVRPETSILVRYDAGSVLDADAAERWLTVTGSVSGVHAGRSRVTRDQQALVFEPRVPFSLGERVTVRVAPEAAPEPGPLGRTRTFAFEIAAELPPAVHGTPEWEGWPSRSALPSGPGAGPAQPVRPFELDLPGDFPVATVVKTGTTGPGFIFATNMAGVGESAYLMILDDSGAPLWYREMPDPCDNFTRQDNGLYSYYDDGLCAYVVLDSTMTPVDQWACANGYTTDEHELRLLPNGHALLISYDHQTVDMSKIVPGGRTSAIVIGLVIQEQDADKQVVFQWRSWDHFQITDCINQNLTRFSIDYVHGNALDVDLDGNLLLSSRNMNEITKIDRVTGDVIWRWGGLHNEFAFVGDTLQFTCQHAIRHLPDGHYTLFDNGNYHKPAFSRACEYVLDEVNHTATLVWSYRNTPDSYGAAMGFVQRLANGNTLISYGSGKPDAIEVAADGTKVFQLTMPLGVSSYRIFRWPVGAPVALSVERAGEPDLALVGPNPVRRSTQLLARLPQPGTVSVTVLDVQGRVVAAPMPPAWHAAGVLSLSVSLAGCPNGVYFCRLQAGGRALVKRLVLVD